MGLLGELMYTSFGDPRTELGERVGVGDLRTGQPSTDVVGRVGQLRHDDEVVRPVDRAG